MGPARPTGGHSSLPLSADPTQQIDQIDRRRPRIDPNGMEIDPLIPSPDLVAGPCRPPRPRRLSLSNGRLAIAMIERGGSRSTRRPRRHAALVLIGWPRFIHSTSVSMWGIRLMEPRAIRWGRIDRWRASIEWGASDGPSLRVICTHTFTRTHTRIHRQGGTGRLARVCLASRVAVP